MKKIEKMTRKDFESLKEISPCKAITCDSIIFLPRKKFHESGFPFIRIIPCIEDKPLGIICGGTDSIWFNIAENLPFDHMNMDFLPTSKLPRIWSRGQFHWNHAHSTLFLDVR